MEKFEEVDQYIVSQPVEIREILEKIREIIKHEAPEAVEGLGYGMPAYKLNGPLVYFAAFKNHIGIYPTPSGIENFKDELKIYKSGKGSIKLPIDKPIPYELIKEIVKYRVKENLAKK